MTERKSSREIFHRSPVIGILRGYPLEIIKELIPVYMESGFNTLEVTMNSSDAVKAIKAISTKFPELCIGAGTVCHEEDLNRAVEAGAQFIVMPILQEKVIKRCVKNGIPVFPGAFTPTEIYQAWNLGATAVKVFPSSQAGPRYIKEILAPLNDLKLLPTGGVSAENIQSYFEAGAVGVGMGSSLFDKQIIEKKDWKSLRTHFSKIKDLIPIVE